MYIALQVKLIFTNSMANSLNKVIILNLYKKEEDCSGEIYRFRANMRNIGEERKCSTLKIR